MHKVYMLKQGDLYVTADGTLSQDRADALHLPIWIKGALDLSKVPTDGAWAGLTGLRFVRFKLDGSATDRIQVSRD